jgi:DNA-3-methyladenine glycosylase
MGQKFSKEFYGRAATSVAPDLLGMHLVRRIDDGPRMVARIVETEAYEGPHDLAAHSALGLRTARTEVMFGAPGRVYVYFIYGMHCCFNVVTAPLDEPHAVLIRALEPIKNVSGRTQGPALLCQALGIDRTLNGADLQGPQISIEHPSPGMYRHPRVKQGPRIGIGTSGVWAKKPWRYYDADSSWLSRQSR